MTFLNFFVDNVAIKILSGYDNLFGTIFSDKYIDSSSIGALLMIFCNKYSKRCSLVIFFQFLKWYNQYEILY